MSRFAVRIASGMRRSLLPLSAVLVGLAGGLPVKAADEAKFVPATATAEDRQFFVQQVQPILKQHCLKCHGAGPKLRGGLRLTGRVHILKGGDLGPAVDLQQPAESYLVQAINYDGLEMPPDGKLPAAKIAVLTEWVKRGLPYVDGDEEAAPSETAQREEMVVTDSDRAHWSYRPVRRPAVPQPRQQGEWVQTPIDAFVLHRLQQSGLTHSSPADRAQLIRRATYSVTGLPPSLDEVQDFTSDSSPDAWEKVVDRLLESPHYGEHWGRHWLDLVRYAETNSFERDGAKPHVWRYRDYVIRAFNNDKPYDQFLREQLAGDELDQVTPETIIATGYYRLGTWDDEPADPKLAEYDDLDDILMTTSQVMLGMTINCARCHDHKLDPIPQRDYYRFLSFFRNIRRYGVRSGDSVEAASVRSIATGEDKRRYAEQLKQHEQRIADAEAEMRDLEQLVVGDFIDVEKQEFQRPNARVDLLRKRVGKLLTKEQFKRYQELTKLVRDLKRNRPKSGALALAVTEHGREARPTHLLIRGNPQAESYEVQPGFPEVLGFSAPEIQPAPDGVPSSGRRRALADWMTNPLNPLTARVMVNRVWQFHFGQGFVRSANDFGFQGDEPTHPELLDWLAAEFMEGGWKLKRLHKLILMSSVFQQSSQGRADALAQDPENRLLWRFNMRRLTAEELRDSILAANGRLNREKMYGPSIYTIIPEAVLQGQSRPGAGWGQSSAEDRRRRSIYIHVKRSLIDPLLASFDFADVDSTCPVRFSTTQPTQALGLLNSDFAQRESRYLAEFIQREAGDDLTAQIKLALTRVMQREPEPAEIERGVKLVRELQQQDQLKREQALQYFCLVALNLNEFVYLD